MDSTEALKPTTLRELEDLCRLMRYWILKTTNRAESGHPTSALSAVELMAGLFFSGRLRFDIDAPARPDNDRVIFSKGHASPLFYSLWAAAGAVSEEELMTYRQFESALEGHPTSLFRLTEAATGSLGQGLSIGVGMAVNSDRFASGSYRTYVLLGDSEMAEGSQWEAMEIAAYYKLRNLVGIIDVNRLGQRGPTMYEHDLSVYERRCRAFGWETVVVEDGHDLRQVIDAYATAHEPGEAPVMVIARTVKGKGVPELEDKANWHGKALDDELMERALNELGEVDTTLRGRIAKPLEAAGKAGGKQRAQNEDQYPLPEYKQGQRVATRDAYGAALARIAPAFEKLIVLDAEVSNSTRSEYFKEKYPERFLEMYIAEQNMVGAALGLSLRGNLPFVSTFAAFFTRAFDQIRMCPYSDAAVKFCGSHSGVSIGEDGPSQMGLEDIAMFRSLLDSTVFYPSDAVSTERLVELMAKTPGVSYIRTTRGKTPVIYNNDESFEVGGSKVLRSGQNDRATIVAAGVTLHEALSAHRELKQAGIETRVIDLYSIKPVDSETLFLAAEETEFVLTVEDHRRAGGIGEAVAATLAERSAPVFSLSAEVRPRSGTPEELLAQQNLDSYAIVRTVKRLLGARPEQLEPLHH